MAYLLLAVPSWATPALVKSGEHESYSRLVLYTGQLQNWQLSRDGEKVSVLVDNWSSGFDLSEVFEKIPRDRITHLSQSANGLELTIGCDCEVLIEPVSKTGIMIDVTDKHPSPTGNPIPPLPPLTGAIQTKLVFPRNDTVAVTALRKKLVESVGKAATQEFLNTTPSKKVSKSNSSHDDIRTPALSTLGHRIRSTSASERAAQSNDPVKPDVACPPDRYGDIENWGTEQPFSLQLSDLRNSLMREFDSTDTAKALRLAQLYIYFSMGAEAASTIQSLELKSQEAQFLKPLAQLVDGTLSTATKLHAPTNGCTGSHAIWAALLGNQNEVIAETQAKLITEAFSHLPHHLKTILGPPLMSRLNKNGHDVAASVVQNSISIALSDKGDSANTSSMLEKVSISELEELIKQGGPQAPSVIVAFLEKKTTAREAVDEIIRDISRSYEVQQHGEKVAVEINRLLTMDTAIRGKFIEALDAALSDTVSPHRENVIAFVSDLLVERGSDMMVAKFALKLQNTSHIETLEPHARSSISQRLSQMGMNELAVAISGQPNESTETKPPPPSKDDPNPASLGQQPSGNSSAPTLLGATSILEESRLVREQTISWLASEGGKADN
jgi:hypothetical protein